MNSLTKIYKISLINYLLIIISFIFVFLLSTFVLAYIQLQNFQKIDTTYQIYAKQGQSSDLDLSLEPPTQIRSKENPVNGVLITSDKYDEITSRKLVVVSINNHVKARPQFGLSKADLVLEVLAEGGITRYNAFYYLDQSVKKIGPVRSARTYMLYFMLGFDDPVFVHEGQAMYPKGEKEVPEINTLKQIYLWNIKSMQTAGSRYRDKDRIRSAGYVHSLMTGFDLINPEIDRLGWREPSNITPLKFKFDAPFDERGKDKQEITIKFTSMATNQYSSSFVYDKQSNSYLRYIAGKKDVDELTGLQLAPKNVIIEYHNYRDAHDGHSRIIIDMLGEDKALIFRDGIVIEGTWKKNDKRDRTKYYDKNGDEITLNRGQIWVINAIKTKMHNITTVDY